MQSQHRLCNVRELSKVPIYYLYLCPTELTHRYAFTRVQTVTVTITTPHLSGLCEKVAQRLQKADLTGIHRWFPLKNSLNEAHRSLQCLCRTEHCSSRTSEANIFQLYAATYIKKENNTLMLICHKLKIRRNTDNNYMSRRESISFFCKINSFSKEFKRKERSWKLN